jgi:sulfatase maturation enzyme AslB (radical SAM superfamily)
MKYYDEVPPNFLLIRFVVTRYCNFRCPYCYLTDERRGRQKTVFSHHSPDEWVNAIDVFKDRHLELYFTGGEPLLFDDFIYFLKKILYKEFVHSVRIDSNLSRLEKFLKEINNPKVKFLASLHPTQVSFEKFTDRVKLLKENAMLALVNLVVSMENMEILNKTPHELARYFEDKGIFLNIAKDFERGLKYGYDEKYKEYIDKLQYPIDNIYMNMQNLHRGAFCGGGKHYISVSRHGNIYFCDGKEHGNIFNHPELPREIITCSMPYCPSIISYSFSASNNFSPVEHLQDYVKRNKTYRENLDTTYLDSLWLYIEEHDLIPKETDIGTDDNKTLAAKLRSRIIKKLKSLS